MALRKHVAGFRHGRLQIVERNDATVTCRCDCGREKTMPVRTFGMVFSCGCLLTEWRNGGGKHASLKYDDPAAFWSRVDKSGGPDACWNWTLSPTGSGYGRVRLQAVRAKPTHRHAYELTFGPIPDGLFALHKCDNRLCCNPSHLFIGSKRDNMLDCMAKGRRYPTHGEFSGNAKLTASQVAEIRALGYSLPTKVIAERYGVTRSHISHIRGRRVWAV